MGLIIESLVAVLLAITIGYCVMLNRRLKGLRLDEGAFRQTVGELVAATEAAAGAVAGLKRAAAERESALSDRIEQAREIAERMDDALAGGEDLIRRLALIAAAGRPSGPAGEETAGAASIGSAAADLKDRMAAIRRRQVRDAAA